MTGADERKEAREKHRPCRFNKGPKQCPWPKSGDRHMFELWGEVGKDQQGDSDNQGHMLRIAMRAVPPKIRLNPGFGPLVPRVGSKTDQDGPKTSCRRPNPPGYTVVRNGLLTYHSPSQVSPRQRGQAAFLATLGLLLA